MSLSRGIYLFKNVRNSLNTHIITRNHGHIWHYRESVEADVPKILRVTGQSLMGFTVWWILWHFWHDSGHVFIYLFINDTQHEILFIKGTQAWDKIKGEHGPYPDPSKWTDAELGIPPDDVD